MSFSSNLNKNSFLDPEKNLEHRYSTRAITQKNFFQVKKRKSQVALKLKSEMKKKNSSGKKKEKPQSDTKNKEVERHRVNN